MIATKTGSEELVARLEALERTCREIKRRYPQAWREDLADIEAAGVPDFIAVARKVDAEATHHGSTGMLPSGGVHEHTGRGSGTASFLKRERGAILAEAENSLARAPTRHYDATAVQQRLARLFDELVGCVEKCDAVPIVRYAERIADERYVAGYDLSEIQVAVNSLEEAAWSQALTKLRGTQLTRTLTLVSTALGAVKDALARRYVLLAWRAHAPSLDVDALFSGSA